MLWQQQQTVFIYKAHNNNRDKKALLIAEWFSILAVVVEDIWMK
jgi:hypothetical protein